MLKNKQHNSIQCFKIKVLNQERRQRNKMKQNRSTQRNGKQVKKENEHIPKYIKSQPWYYQETGKSDDYLIHHRQGQDKKKLFDIENNEEAKLGTGISDKFIKRTINLRNTGKGEKRCDNCGKLGHFKKDCLERPRKFHRNNKDNKDNDVSIRDDENMDWDAKKDRWFGYTGKEYDKVISNWEDSNKNKKETEKDAELKYDRDEEIELYKLGLMKDSKGLLKQRVFSEQERALGRTSVRLREDKAAYLNDINSSDIKYDPKSRLYKSESLGYVDDRTKMFRRHLTGQGLELEELTKFNRELSRQEGIKDAVKDTRKLEHVLIANPTKYEKLMKEAQEKVKNDLNSPQKRDYSQLEAQKIEGKKQDDSKKKTLQDMYD